MSNPNQPMTDHPSRAAPAAEFFLCREACGYCADCERADALDGRRVHENPFIHGLLIGASAARGGLESGVIPIWALDRLQTQARLENAGTRFDRGVRLSPAALVLVGANGEHGVIRPSSRLRRVLSIADEHKYGAGPVHRGCAARRGADR